MLKCPQKAYILRAGQPADGLLRSDWILRAWTSLMDKSTDEVII
jgi:hypothetical protein